MSLRRKGIGSIKEIPMLHIRSAISALYLYFFSGEGNTPNVCFDIDHLTNVYQQTTQKGTGHVDMLQRTEALHCSMAILCLRRVGGGVVGQLL